MLTIRVVEFFMSVFSGVLDALAGYVSEELISSIVGLFTGSQDE